MNGDEFYNFSKQSMTAEMRACTENAAPAQRQRLASLEQIINSYWFPNQFYHNLVGAVRCERPRRRSVALLWRAWRFLGIAWRFVAQRGTR